MVGLSDDDDQIEADARRFKKAGAETLDAAREQWWIGLRDAEAVAYSKPEHFAREENTFRSGFAAALEPPVRGRSFDQRREYLSTELSGCLP